MTEREKVSVPAFVPEIIEAGTYPATVVEISALNGDYGPYAMWIFQPDGYTQDARPAGFTSLSAARSGKAMEWARRILGKSDATDTLYGKDMQDKRPIIDWGEDELRGGRCKIVVETKWDENEEVYRNVVANVLPEGAGASPGAPEEDEEDFSEIPF